MEGLEELESLHIAGKHINGTDLVENRNQTLDTGLSHSQAIPLLGMLPRRTENKDAHIYLYAMLITVIFPIAKM